MKKSLSLRGFSLVEVMIAATIGITLIFAFYWQINSMRNTMHKLEKRVELGRIKNTIINILTDYEAWQNAPFVSPPSYDNEQSFYAYVRGELRPVSRMNVDNTLLNDEASDQNYAIDCGPENQVKNCRVIDFNYNGALISPDDVTLNKPHFKAAITFLDEEPATRSFIPRLHVHLFDTHSKSDQRTFPMNFTLNDQSTISQESPAPSKSAISNTNTNLSKSSPSTRSSCYRSAFELNDPMDAKLAMRLCSVAVNLSPSQCFYDLRKLIKSTDKRQSYCKFAKNNMAVKCFLRANKSFELTLDQSFQLCIGTTSFAPIECLEKFKSEFLDSTSITMNIATNACGTASDTRPVVCLKDLKKLNNNKFMAGMGSFCRYATLNNDLTAAKAADSLQMIMNRLLK